MALPTWELIRAAGLTSYFLLFVSAACGILFSIKVATHKTNQLLQITHQSAGWISLLFGLFHGLLLYIDTYKPYTLTEIFIPFTTKEETLLNGFGTISLYLLVLLFISGDIMKKIGAKVWRRIHGLALPLVIIASVHGILLGTDASNAWAIILYAGALAIILSLLIVKLLLIKAKTKKVVSA
ncbi:ferric reductase-like transmembrane domain-containing protein [Schinkia azotoformans]|uniref:Ferric reductase domain-containing protein n=1 Tax=Schinkia azotoformans LMG 9581 TaxID=1131731 RepID=K6DJW3_SCHAZ|nr:ferric reductase-like transmembrane domain-containing protein [Schinkia azotoformans]EKN68423.1 Ferric reductase domain-containing protein [Schinkia azotoformans LMG 9581]MEC1638463.1 ferric reductase-like transmembrane domain-containing protein [Schinkia azotoformans]MEC1721320.1 ferric reductase-like transmembrane domain-containing protein [Schinkia azotoformans]MEC1946103.1 ferric reductase-like transmembrane domain-containing protein [Schinkia azotoformans]MED4351605.1 ferric reductase-